MILAIFSLSGKMPVESDWLIINVSGLVIIGSIYLRSLEEVTRKDKDDD